MKRGAAAATKLGTAVCAVALLLAWPQARHGARLLAAQDDPARLADLQLDTALARQPDLVAENITAALDAHDADLARSLVELADARHIAVDSTLRQRVTNMVAEENSGRQLATRFATGLLTGRSDDIAGLSGTVAGDLFVFGDVRDMVREGKHLVAGEDTDRLILGLAAAGIAVTAATYVTVGGAAPVRAGLTLVKDARKVGRLSEGLAKWAGRSAREVVDTPALQRAVGEASLLRPGATLEAVKASIRSEKAGGLVRLAKDVGRVGEKAGTRGAFDALKVAEGPKDVARAARLAESKAGQTRGILKILGRGALLLTTGFWNIAWWIFSAAITLFGLVTSLKAGVERMTQSHLDRRKAKRARRLLAQAHATREAPRPASLAAAA